MSDWRDLRAVAPTRLPGARPGGLYGMALLVLVLSVIASVLVYAYAHLAANSAGWPPEGVESEGRLPLLATALLAVLAAIGTTMAYRYAHADERDRGHVLAALVSAAVLGGVAAGVLVAWVAGLPYSGNDHAYGAAVVTMSVFVAGVLVAGVLGAALVSAWVVLGHAGTAPADSIRVLRTLHWFGAVVAVVILGVLALGGGS